MKLLEKSWLVFSASIILALVYPDFSRLMEPLLTPGLMLLMTVSTTEIDFSKLYERSALKMSGLLFLVNLGLSGLIIVLSLLLIKNADYHAGMIVMAAVPCAISVIPFTKLLKGRTAAATSGLIVSYFLYLLLTPAIIWLFFRESIDSMELLRNILLLVIIPLILSRFLRQVYHRWERHDRSITNAILFFLMYGFIGLNQEAIVSNFLGLGSVLFVLLMRTFGIVTMAYFALKLLKIKKHDAVPIMLFASFKNLGYASLLALALFSEAASLPPTLGIIFEMIGFVWIEFLARRL